MGPDGTPDAPATPPWRRLTVIGPVVGLVVVAAVLWFVFAPGDPDEDPSAGASPGSTSSTPAPAPSSAPSASPTPSAVPSTPVPGTPGTAAPTETVPTPAEQEELDAPIDGAATPRRGVEVEVARVQAVQGEARGIGEVAGPAVRVTLALTNSSGEAISLGNALATMSYGRDDVPASDLSGPGARPFPARVADGDTARGTFVFSVPRDERRRVKVRFSYTTAAPAVVFSGPASGAGS